MDYSQLIQNWINGKDFNSWWGPQSSSVDAVPGSVSGFEQLWPMAYSNDVMGLNQPDSSGQSVGEMAADRQMWNGGYKKKVGYHYNASNSLSGKGVF